MFSLLGNQNLQLLTRGFETEVQGKDLVVKSRVGSVTVTIDRTGYPPHVKSTTMDWKCGHDSNCFDHLAAGPSDSGACSFADACPALRFLPYMPEIYVASTFDEHVRNQNVNLKQALHHVGLMAILPQHLSVGNPKRQVQGGLLAEDPKSRSGELATLGGRWCEAVMRRCDGAVVVLNRMKQDSSWETGFLHALRVPILAVYYEDSEQDPLEDYARNWMVRLTDFMATVKFPSDSALAAFGRLAADIHLRKQAQN